MAINLPIYNLDPAQVTARGIEVPLADFAGGVNMAGSCAGGIGINTGDYSPKVTDWAPIADIAAHRSQHIGQANNVLQVDQGADINDQPAFVQTAGIVAPGGELDVTTGALNLTGKTVPSGAFAWGVIPIV